jgi:hypothetical protein
MTNFTIPDARYTSLTGSAGMSKFRTISGKPPHKSKTRIHNFIFQWTKNFIFVLCFIQELIPDFYAINIGKRQTDACLTNKKACSIC